MSCLLVVLMPQRIVNFSLSRDVLELLDRIARERGLSRSELIRSIIEGYVRKKLR